MNAMTKVLLACAAIAALSPAFAAEPPSAPSAPPNEGMGDPVHGQVLFVSKGCVECHAVRGAGGHIGPDLGRTAVKGSFYEVSAALWNHSVVMDEKMREFRMSRPSFAGDELLDLVAFLYFLNYFDEPGSERTGRTLFSEMHCIRCHRAGGEGGSVGPALENMSRNTPPLQIAQSLWNHGPQMVAAIKKLGLDMPTFQGTQIIDLFAYLRSQGRRGGQRSFHTAGDSIKGKELFAAKNCSRCHDVFGDGHGIGPDLGTAELRGSVTQLTGRMWNHWPAMSEAMGAMGMAPPTFQGDELADVFAYIFVSRHCGQPASAKEGHTVYLKKGCGTCHGGEGQGGVGPPLKETLSGKTKEAIAQTLWNHAPQMYTRMSEQRIQWPRLEAAELAALLRFLGNGFTEAAPADAGQPATSAPAGKKGVTKAQEHGHH